MNAPDWLPWLNVLILPALGFLARIAFQLGKLVATVAHHEASFKSVREEIAKVDSDLGDLRQLVFSRVDSRG